MENTSQQKNVLVSGASGYIGSRLVITLLENGYQVRGTVRSPERGEELLRSLAPLTGNLENLSLFTADLLSDQGWDQAVSGCDFVHHVASPFPLEAPEDENDLIRPAVEGTVRVLSAAARNGVKRVVLTSSVAAVSGGHHGSNGSYNEENWANLAGDIGAYPKSKTLAEKKAWDYMESLAEDCPLELAVINPCLVIGPVIDSRERTSNELLVMLMNAKLPGVTQLKFNLVDVRDVADAHIAAMQLPSAAGKRFLCVGGGMWLPAIVKVLKDYFGPLGYRVPSFVFPDWFVRLYALFDTSVEAALPDLGKDLRYDTTFIQQELNWKPRQLTDSLTEMGESLIENGLVKPRKMVS